MAGHWYPVIDYMLCAECGRCTRKCSHGVYNPARAPVPVVLRPGACIDHCHGCGNLCPTGAITYLGDDTGWVPPHRLAAACAEDCGRGATGTAAKADVAPGCGCGGVSAAARADADAGCGCGCERGCDCDSAPNADNTVTVEYLYLNLKECDRCIGTAQALDEVMATLTPALETAGFAVRYRKVEMVTAELAGQYRLLASPTVRVNGRDIAARVTENHCGCCSALVNSEVTCRVFEYGGKTFEVAPKQMLAQGILSVVFGNRELSPDQEPYRLPDHLARFFAGRR